jgi:peptidoglycan/xylan/chitin deacetylase (PgdA/CDA1 family)
MRCAVDIDTVTRNDYASIDTGLDRAAARGEVLELFAHVPGTSVSWDAVEHVFAGAAARGLAFVTYADLARGDVPAGGALAFAFDDDHVDAWMEGRPTYAKYGVHLTLFVTRYARLQDSERADLKLLASEGHDIEPHSVSHQRGPLYVEEHGLAAYMDDEVGPSIDLLIGDGYDLTTYAYPFGARTDETDREILKRVTQLRSVALAWDSPVDSPCPL